MVHLLQILKTQKMHFLKQIVFEKASNHYFLQEMGFWKMTVFVPVFLVKH